MSYVEADQVVSVDAQTTPTGIGRIYAADSNPATTETVELASPLPPDCAGFLRSLQNPGPADPTDPATQAPADPDAART